jgi:hypothetical protein
MSDYVLATSSQNSIQCPVKCNMGRGPGKALEIMTQNQMSLHNAIWAKFGRWTRSQNKMAQYSVLQTIKEQQKTT